MIPTGCYSVFKGGVTDLHYTGSDLKATNSSLALLNAMLNAMLGQKADYSAPSC